jgi:hypothetical protein
MRRREQCHFEFHHNDYDTHDHERNRDGHEWKYVFSIECHDHGAVKRPEDGSCIGAYRRRVQETGEFIEG